eukprot:11312798-Heterocapsa_arctica.AAC.1
MHLYLLIDVTTWCRPRRRTRVARSGAYLRHYMDFVNRRDPQLFYHAESGALLSVFADDLLLLVPDRELDNIKHTLDIDLKIKWCAQIGPEWVRYLGKEWRCRDDNGHFEVR